MGADHRATSLRWIVAVALATLLLVASAGGAVKDDDDNEKKSVSCDIFLAPSRWSGGGFAVYSGRDFEPQEIVELSPLFVPMDYDRPVIKNSVLDDYIYGYMRLDRSNNLHRLANVAAGAVMFYNHHPTRPNIEYTAFGREPNAQNPADVNVVGMVAKLPIRAGDELFSTYGDMYEDGGKTWFAERELTLRDIDAAASSLDATELEQLQQTYCSRIVSGMGQSTFKTRLQSMWPEYLPAQWSWMANRLPPVDAPLDAARAAVSLEAGDRIELAPALVLSGSDVQGTPLARLGFWWSQDLTDEHRQMMRSLREQKPPKWTVQFQGPSSQWKRVDRFQSYQDIVLFPIAGSISMVKRVEREEPAANCRLEIKAASSFSLSNSGSSNRAAADDDNVNADGNAGIVFELIATQPVEAGETLYLNIPAAGTAQERAMLDYELQKTGQSPRQQQVGDDASASSRLKTEEL